MSADADLSALSFEEALSELETIVRGLESGQQRLQDAIDAYERGSALRRHCEAKLSEAEMRVERIVAAGAPALPQPALPQVAPPKAAPPRRATEPTTPSAGDLDEEIPF